VRARNQDSRPVLPSPLHRSTQTTSRPPSGATVSDGRSRSPPRRSMAGRERETCQGRSGKLRRPQVLTGKVLCSTTSGSCLLPASCETAVFRSASAAKRTIWGSHTFPAPSGRSGAVQPGSPERQRRSKPRDAAVEGRRDLGRTDDEIARRGGEARRRGRGRRQDKAEGRTVPKCARLLIGARPSGGADAISHFSARAVWGPWPEGGSGTRDGSLACRRRVLRLIPRAARRGD